MSDHIVPRAPDVDNAAAGSAAAEANAVLSGRIDILFRLARHHLFLPFSALCLAVALYAHTVPVWLAVVPLVLQIAATVSTGQVAQAYFRRQPDSDPRIWARRITWCSAFCGAAWGVGAVIWFAPGNFGINAFLTVAFLGMTAAEYIVRCMHRQAYLAHASLSLGPLAVMLFMEHTTYSLLSCVLVMFFGGVLYTYSDGVAAMIDDAVRLRFENASLVMRLSREKKTAETARDAAEASARAKSAFVANISHEIRTPLNALLGMAQLLERSELDRVQRGHVKVLLEAGRGLKTLLDDVIALSNQEGDDEAFSDEDCDAAQAVRTVARLLQPRAWEKQIRLIAHADNGLPRVAADPRHVRRVLLKLADNAVKFTDRGLVEIRVESVPGEDGRQMLSFEVRDTGHGLPPEVAEHLFEPFTPGDNSYARRHDGAGLGLAVAKRTVEALGGQIGFKSEPGAGSLFWFTVPAARAVMTESREAAPIAADAAPPWGLSLLVMTRDEGARTQLTNLLEPFGNRLSFADSISSSVSLAARESFEVIIASADDADTLAAALRGKIPVLALQAAGNRPPHVASAVLRWPATAGALYTALRDLLGRTADNGGAPYTQGDQHAAIDAEAFSTLEKSLGFSTLIEILQSYMKTAEDLCSALSRASDEEKWEDAARVAQDIAGAAGGLGLSALTSAARNFTQSARDGTDPAKLQETAASVIEEHARVARALMNLYPDLAA